MSFPGLVLGPSPVVRAPLSRFLRLHPSALSFLLLLPYPQSAADAAAARRLPDSCRTSATFSREHGSAVLFALLRAKHCRVQNTCTFCVFSHPKQSDSVCVCVMRRWMCSRVFTAWKFFCFENTSAPTVGKSPTGSVPGPRFLNDDFSVFLSLPILPHC